jgi:hypothetical protein
MAEPANLFNPLDHPLCLDLPARVSAVAWHEHIPFAKVLVELARPAVLVELGVHKGDSYLALCEAVAATRLDTACYGVDTWLGDQHSGLYGEEVYADLRAYHDPLYGKFSRLVRGTFDEAEKHFQPGSIDLLHLDGAHTYEAVKHDWETWRGKLSSRGVVLFHDVNVREHDFGVWRLWDELRTRYPSFAFLHGHGLGVLVTGPGAPTALRDFLGAAASQSALLDRFFFALGNRITLYASVRALQDSARQLEAKVADYHVACQGKDAGIAALQGELGESRTALSAKDAEIAKLQSGLQENQVLRARIGELESELRQAHARLADLAVKARADAAARADAELREREAFGQVAQVKAGISYRVGRLITAPARWWLKKA